MNEIYIPYLSKFVWAEETVLSVVQTLLIQYLTYQTISIYGVINQTQFKNKIRFINILR